MLPKFPENLLKASLIPSGKKKNPQSKSEAFLLPSSKSFVSGSFARMTIPSQEFNMSVIRNAFSICGGEGEGKRWRFMCKQHSTLSIKLSVKVFRGKGEKETFSEKKRICLFLIQQVTNHFFKFGKNEWIQFTVFFVLLRNRCFEIFFFYLNNLAPWDNTKDSSIQLWFKSEIFQKLILFRKIKKKNK